MSNTKREPLLSDEQLSGVVIFPGGGRRHESEMAGYEVRAIYAADSANKDELIQRLVDTLGMIDKYAERDTMSSEEEDVIVAHCNEALAAAEAAGFKPSEP